MRSKDEITDDSGQAPPLDLSLVADVRELARSHLTPQMQRLTALVDDRLFQLSGKASSPALESEYFVTMRLLRREAAAWKEHYQAVFLGQFDRFWEVAAPDAAPLNRAEALPESDLRLVAEDAFEEDLAIAGMAEKGLNLFGAPLFSLGRRLAKVARRDQVRDDENPIGPLAFCRAFADALRPLPLDVPTKLLIYKLFDQAVVQSLGELYGQIDQLLIDRGVVLPVPEHAKPAPAGGPAPAAHAAGFAPEAGRFAAAAGDGHDIFVEFFEELQEFLDQWRARIGIYPRVYDAPAAAPEDVMGVLDVLQRSPPPAPGSDSLKARIHRHLSEDSEVMRLPARREEDVIDMVGLLFDFILEEPLLPNAVKLIILRLQVPVVKVAIMERAFFGRKNHPARLLLNALAQAGMGLDLDHGGRDQAVLNAIAQAVNRVVDEFEFNSLMFASVLDEFMLFMDKDAQRSRIVEERTVQSTQSKEQLLLCKRRIAHEIAVRIHGKPIPAPIRTFLFNPWKDVMLLAYLRRDRAPEDWERSLAVVDRLVERAQRPVPATAEAGKSADWQQLIAAVREGLMTISLDPMLVRAALSDLKNCLLPRHAASALDLLQDRPKSHGSALVDAMEAIEDASPSPRDQAGAGHLPAAEALGSQQIPPEYLDEARSLAVGQWVEFVEGHRRIPAKLSWRSQLSDTLVFVNRKGAKVAEMTLTELAGNFANGSARTLHELAVPMMDRALDALVATLKGAHLKPLPGGPSSSA